jgi:hypothetical protein
VVQIWGALEGGVHGRRSKLNGIRCYSSVSTARHVEGERYRGCDAGHGDPEHRDQDRRR